MLSARCLFIYLVLLLIHFKETLTRPDAKHQKIKSSCSIKISEDPDIFLKQPVFSKIIHKYCI
ncbi:unnamed protein product [Rhodiola kirilowii]